ncbi:alpha/beta fold hydrolase [Aquabacterium humicola]|uniref:alpha/beta fold hydrolase n=1 Tax=Aquabacterium humicola TaxID=3237377 RepID=UPI002543BABD|nr:alpha/beta fold hydrolase [Rubrivivax pictus]
MTGPTDGDQGGGRPALSPDTDTLRYCTTADGVRLAMRQLGQGPLVIKAANWLGNVQADATLRSSRHWVDQLTRAHTLLWYDARGCGLSDREVDDVSLDAWVRDLEAVADAGGHERFVLLGISQGAAIAIRYAVRHPERVRGLVLYASFVRGAFHQGLSAKTQAVFTEMIRIAELGWGHDASTFRRLFSSQLLPAAPADVLDAYDALHRHSVSGPMAARYMRAFFELDARVDAPQVRCPTLVMHVQDDALILQREGALVASLIPGARWVAVPGRNHLPLVTDPGWPTLQREMAAFLASLAAADAGAGTPAPQLTARQREVLLHVARGLGDKEIARALQLSPRTVEMHVARALAALGARNRSEAVSRAHHWKLLP